MEIGLRRLEGVDKIAISISQQALRLDLKAGTPFQARAIRDAVAPAEVTIKRFLIVARGVLEESESKRYFVSGPDRFLVVDAPQDPPSRVMRVIAEVDDLAVPMEMKIKKWDPVEDKEELPKTSR